MISSVNLLVLVVLLAACFVAVEAQWGMPYGGYGGYGRGYGGYGMRGYGRGYGMGYRPYGGFGRMGMWGR